VTTRVSVATAAPLLGCLALAGAASAEATWADAEQGALRHHAPLTTPGEFTKAGEAYFNPDASWIIFQAVPEGQPKDAHYQMYVAKLERDEGGRVTGLGETIRVSPEGSANTCGWFNPRAPHSVIFGSTVEPFTASETAGYQRDTSEYEWLFPREMDIVTRTIPAIFYDQLPEGTDDLRVSWGEEARRPVRLFERDGYDAEGAYSPDGRYIVHTHVDPGSGDGDIYIFDTFTGENHPIITEPGYDGGPFFSPDGKRITYRSDRQGNDLLQLFIADLAFDDSGAPSLARERAITRNRHVNWAPYWDPSGEFLVYTTSEIGHRNYEVFSIEVPAADDPEVSPSELKRRRITDAAGFDGMPVISPDGSLLMWTTQRREGSSDPGSSQVWIAEIESLAP
jgi:TolB protein